MAITDINSEDRLVQEPFGLTGTLGRDSERDSVFGYGGNLIFKRGETREAVFIDQRGA